MAVVRCAGCHSYVNRDVAVRAGIQSFCSRSCQGDYFYADKHRPKNSVKVKTSKPKSKPNPDIPKKLRDEVLAADHRCRGCNTTRNLHLHHVVYRGQKYGYLSGDHVRHNLITLCVECHQRVHTDKKRFLPILLGMIWKRDVEGSNYYTLIDSFEKRYMK